MRLSFLLEELDKAGYITVQDAKSTPRKDNKRYVYNRTKYKQIEEDSEIFSERQMTKVESFIWKT